VKGLKGAKPLLEISFSPLKEVRLTGVPKRGVSPSFKTISPSPLQERGIKGVR